MVNVNLIKSFSLFLIAPTGIHNYQIVVYLHLLSCIYALQSAQRNIMDKRIFIT